ncbi:hypothetical protein [Heyndrickxia acidicola]|uniref:Uncharacterized protein n=1 Tax=Heyndrickxia acidicola TaxID=209389 RepID=A0ABU6MGD1_9BACI|nr:hypothetical protein [Heyndrickxia acidicola]MED1203726.1 hypothetical protein [Heyndrickxia acidicola]
MVSEFECLLFIKELGRLLIELNNCSDNQVRSSIQQDIFLLGKALVSMSD